MTVMTIKSETHKFPKLRFTEFSDEWKHKKLSELLSESKKRNLDLKFSKDEVLSVSGESGIVNQIEHMGRSYAGESVHNYHIVETGDIVYTKSPLKANPYGIIKLNKGKSGIVSTLYAVYHVNESTAYGPFLDFYFSLDANTNRYLRPLVKKGAKNDMKINNSYVLHDKIFVPSVDEQKRVSSFLTILDEEIGELKKNKDLLVGYKNGMIQRIFLQNIRFKDKKERFPEWKNKQLSEIGKTFNGLVGKTAESFGFGEPFVTYKQIFDNSEIDVQKFALVKIDKNEKQNKAQFGDVFFTTSSETPEEVGFSSVLLDKNVSPYLNSFSFGFRPNSLNEFNPYFAKFIFRSPLFRKEIVKLAQGSTRYNISKIEFMKTKILIPSIQEQQKIADFLSSIDKVIESKQQQIILAEQWKKGLIQELFV
jgi:type I restriction enzyme S subunit